MTINKAMATLLQLPIAVILSVSMQIGRSLIPDPATGIDEVSATNAGKQVLFSLNGRKLYIKNLPAKSSVTLYDLQGRLVMTVQADNQGCATLQLPATGLATPYVVRTASINFKIIAK
jgi:hypothetical protein